VQDAHESIVQSAGVSPRISVVAPTYRRRHGLPRFVEPLLREPELDELVMAVDGSDDGSVEWLQERRRVDDRIVVLDLPNRGAGATRQAGIEAATGDVVLLLDDDVIAAPGLVAGHAAHHAELGRKVVIGYMPNDWEHLPPGRRGIAYIYREAYELRVSEFRAEPGLVLHGFWGGNFSMPRADFLRIGVEGIAVKRGQDDREFGIRCAKAGMHAVFDESLVGEHLYDRDLAGYRYDCRLQGESRRLIHDAHPDLVGDELADDPEPTHVADAVGQRLPGAVRRAWPLLARDPFFGPVTEALTALFESGVRLEHLGVEVQSARAIGSLETMRGVLERS
jgi:glycosyltransferase involved in cell wall biosynthesis